MPARCSWRANGYQARPGEHGGGLRESRPGDETARHRSSERTGSKMRIGTCMASLLAILSATPAVEAADLTTRQVIEALRGAAPDAPADFSGKDLNFLDLSELDFRHADLSGADLRSANLTGANLAGADLSGANLTRTIIIRANFSGADLSDASALPAGHLFERGRRAHGGAGSSGARTSPGARLVVHLTHADLSGADFTGRAAWRRGARTSSRPLQRHADLVVEPHRREFLRRQPLRRASS